MKKLIGSLFAVTLLSGAGCDQILAHLGVDPPVGDDLTALPGAGHAHPDGPTELTPFELNKPDHDDFVAEPPADDDDNEK